MQAIIFNQYGSVDVLERAELLIPKPKQNDLIVEIHACALNPIDYKLRSGVMKDVMPITFPFVPGCDISGVVRDTGSDVKNFKKGDEVYFASELTLAGGYAEFCAVDADLVALKPKKLDHVQAASLPIAGLTTLQALRDYSNIQSHHKILIHAGAGGVGTFALQYAKSIGAEIYTTGSKANHEYLYVLGADYCIDYKDEDFLKACEDAGKMDIVFETIGGLNYVRSILATKPEGVVPCIVNPPDSDVVALSELKNIKTDFVLVAGGSRDLNYMTQMVDQNQIKPQVAEIIDFKLEQIQSAHKLLESGHSRGKMVIKIK